MEESIEQFTAAALAYEMSGKGEDALACFVRIAQIDPENRDRHVAVAELAERLGNHAAAARGYLRAGQLSTRNTEEAIEYYAKAQKLAPADRSAALLYAQALLRKGDAAAAAAQLARLSDTEKDIPFLETYADALMRSSQLDAARAVLERMTNQGAGSAEKLFDLATGYLRAGEDANAVDILSVTKKACSRPGAIPSSPMRSTSSSNRFRNPSASLSSGRPFTAKSIARQNTLKLSALSSIDFRE